MPKIQEIVKITKVKDSKSFEKLAKKAKTCYCGEYSDEVIVKGTCHICNRKK